MHKYTLLVVFTSFMSLNSMEQVEPNNNSKKNSNIFKHNFKQLVQLYTKKCPEPIKKIIADYTNCSVDDIASAQKNGYIGNAAKVDDTLSVRLGCNTVDVIYKNDCIIDHKQYRLVAETPKVSAPPEPGGNKLVQVFKILKWGLQANKIISNMYLQEVASGKKYLIGKKKFTIFNGNQGLYPDPLINKEYVLHDGVLIPFDDKKEPITVPLLKMCSNKNTKDHKSCCEYPIAVDYNKKIVVTQRQTDKDLKNEFISHESFGPEKAWKKYVVNTQLYDETCVEQQYLISEDTNNLLWIDYVDLNVLVMHRKNSLYLCKLSSGKVGHSLTDKGSFTIPQKELERLTKREGSCFANAQWNGYVKFYGTTKRNVTADKILWRFDIQNVIYLQSLEKVLVLGQFHWAFYADDVWMWNKGPTLGYMIDLGHKTWHYLGEQPEFALTKQPLITYCTPEQYFEHECYQRNAWDAYLEKEPKALQLIKLAFAYIHNSCGTAQEIQKQGRQLLNLLENKKIIKNKWHLIRNTTSDGYGNLFHQVYNRMLVFSSKLLG